MKKLVAIMLTLTLIMGVGSALGEVLGEFSISDYENAPNYDYDKFDKEWSCYGAYSKEYNDAYVVIGLECFGTANGVNCVELYCWVRDENNKNVLYDVQSIDILIGDMLYSFDDMYVDETSSWVLLGEDSKPLIEAMASTDAADIRLSYKTGSLTYELSGNDYSTTLKPIAEILKKNNTIDFSLMGESAETVRICEELFPITIS